MSDRTPSKPSSTKQRFPLLAIGSLLVVEAFLFASAYYRWFGFNRHKG
jgi:hypothetical protein